VDLILAAAQDYEWESLRPFVESLHESGFRGEVRFFVSGLSGETVGKLEATGVRVSRPGRIRARLGTRVFQPYNPRTTRLRWHVQPLYRHVVRTLASLAPDSGAATRRLAGALANVEVARFFWYRDYLSRTPARYRNVMLTDVRDVLFLGSPFDFDIGASAYFFLEHEGLRLRDTVNNRGWLIGAYGEGALEELGGRPISCSGVTIGAAPAVLAYLDVMVDHLVRLSRQYKGIDQGVHNYVLHKGLVPRARLVPNGQGVVLTAGLMPPDEAVELLRERSQAIKIVHQYDRHPELAQALAARTAITPIP
jgi:hypothetical protein